MKKDSQIPNSCLWLLIAAILVIRAISLESPSLIDPSESRYASLAYSLFESGDWAIPILQTPEGAIPYFSKPPLHFWLTAISYSAFGIDEWVARLPSFLAFLAICLVVYRFAYFAKGHRTALWAVLICATSPLLFLLSGSSIIDVTFTAFITIALYAYCEPRLRQVPNRSLASDLLLYAAAAGAFMEKGPVGLILIGIPILLDVITHKDFSIFKPKYFVSGLVLFLMLATPWFFIAEQRYPGTAWYFFYHENFLRYLVHDFGTRYGTGHLYPYGSIWWMTIVGMLPWSIPLGALAYLLIRKGEIRALLWQQRWLRFCFFWGIAPMFFFTFARQILATYTLPIIPALSLFLALSFKSIGASKLLASSSSRADRIFSGFRHHRFITASIIPCLLIPFLLFMSPRLSTTKSAATILELLTKETMAERPKVLVAGTRNLSPFWLGAAWEQELSKPIDVQYIEADQIDTSLSPNLLIRRSRGSDLIEVDPEEWNLRHDEGNWLWYHRIHSSERNESSSKHLPQSEREQKP